ncbi:putative phiE125 gp8 family phage protein [Novosphingobium kunmingense]|uniref:Putative phiE125 gp8 family phage protein n=1 Tax=Novosphingobium kunmingense TaxID=1211806 RepID=A0A2N0HL08_9SPHN|nr:hypothetical protein [Novosphingobium kunmingense]PKB19653.1 putative phiE125 gp8 family phage protein [Novosphingobium kunmingense]
MTNPTLITAATGLPVALDVIKQFSGYEDSDKDALFTLLAKAAVKLVEEWTGRSLGEQTWQLTLAGFDCPIELSRGPVLAVTGIEYDPADGGDAIDLTDTVWSLDLVGDPARVVLDDGQSWPALATTPGPVRVTYTTGYAAVPEPLQLAICAMVRDAFDNRGMPALSGAVIDSLSPYRTLWICA